jgi:hypothetical protein
VSGATETTPYFVRVSAKFEFASKLFKVLETQVETAEKLPLMLWGDVNLMLSQMLQNRFDEPETLLETIYQRQKIR